MWILQKYLPVLCLASLGATKLAKRGFLDRLVAYHKKNFLEELSRLPTPLTVTVEKAPPGFVDSPHWDKESVLRLVMLVEVLDAKPARQAIRRALSPSRRLYLAPGKNTFDLFPSWGKDSPNDFAYDDMVDYSNEATGPLTMGPPLTEDTVVYISNPVEAHLPSARVTVKLLREIMEVRAAGLRAMPTTTHSTHSWKSKNTTTSSGNSSDGSTAGADGSTAAADGSTAAADGSTAAADGSTAAADGSTAGDATSTVDGSSTTGSVASDATTEAADTTSEASTEESSPSTEAIDT